MERQIEYTTKCDLCEEHATSLGILKGLEKTVKENFPDWTIDRQADLVINWFEKIWQLELANFVEKSKKDTMEKIQSYKTRNIKAINQ